MTNLAKNQRILIGLLEGSGDESLFWSWRRFKESRPKMAELLIEVFGKEKAVEVHEWVKDLSESKASTAVNFLKTHMVEPTRCLD